MEFIQGKKYRLVEDDGLELCEHYIGKPFIYWKSYCSMELFTTDDRDANTMPFLINHPRVKNAVLELVEECTITVEAGESDSEPRYNKVFDKAISDMFRTGSGFIQTRCIDPEEIFKMSEAKTMDATIHSSLVLACQDCDRLLNRSSKGTVYCQTKSCKQRNILYHHPVIKLTRVEITGEENE